MGGSSSKPAREAAVRLENARTGSIFLIVPMISPIDIA
jgi:hypothetical protein